MFLKMDAKNIIQQGELVKYIITSRNPNFNIEEDDFTVELIYGMLGRKLVIPKSEMVYGTDGEYLMQFSTAGMVGKVTARMTFYVHDTDVNPDGERQEVDEQVIAFVVTTPCPTLIHCPTCSSDGHDVHYERTEESDIAAKYLRLVATETVTPEHGEPYTIYRPLITKNDEYLYVLREKAEEVTQRLLQMANKNK
jgi:hypothetical protein